MILYIIYPVQYLYDTAWLESTILPDMVQTLSYVRNLSIWPCRIRRGRNREHMLWSHHNKTRFHPVLGEYRRNQDLLCGTLSQPELPERLQNSHKTCGDNTPWDNNLVGMDSLVVRVWGYVCGGTRDVNGTACVRVISMATDNQPPTLWS